jgi:hypothetical protein
LRELVAVIGLVAAAACVPASKPPPAEQPMIASMVELGLLMKNEINPSFSRLSFLMFHGDTVETDEATLTLELERHAALLHRAIGQLRAMHNVPTRTTEGRTVFFTYVDSVGRSTEKLVEVIGIERSQAAALLEQIATTCNNCHHFFRLRIDDAVVPVAANVK